MRRLILPVVLLLALGGAVAPLLARRRGAEAVAPPVPSAPPSVETASAVARATGRTLYLSGTLRSGSEAALSALQGGLVAAVRVRAGSVVTRGQVLLELEAADLRRQVEAAAAGTRGAAAQAAQAQAGLRLKEADVERRVREAKRGETRARLQVEKAEAGVALARQAAAAKVRQAEAAVDAARAALARVLRPARPEQRRQAELSVQSAERGEQAARKALDDVQFLYDRGGVPRRELEAAQERHRQAEDALAQARAALALLDAGPAPEERTAAEAQLRGAEAGLAAAQAAAATDPVDRADLNVAAEQLRAAQEGVRDAEAARGELTPLRHEWQAAVAARDRAAASEALARQALAATAIRSPVDGRVAAVHLAVGELASPGQPAVTVVGAAGVYLEAAAPARTLPHLRVGQAVTVTVDSLPGRRLPGAIRSVGAAAGADGRTFPVEVDISARPGELKPGGLARVEVRVVAAPDTVAVPAAALRPAGDGSAVWVIRAGIARQTRVEVVLQDGDMALIRGVQPGEAVAVAGADALRDGDRVREADSP
jgi:RND family efflux transporter MFP subunit